MYASLFVRSAGLTISMKLKEQKILTNKWYMKKFLPEVFKNVAKKELSCIMTTPLLTPQKQPCRIQLKIILKIEGIDNFYQIEEAAISYFENISKWALMGAFKQRIGRMVQLRLLKSILSIFKIQISKSQSVLLICNDFSVTLL